MKHLLTSVLLTVSMTLTTARGMEKDINKDNPFLSLPKDIQHEILGYPLKLSGEQVNTLRGLGKDEALKTLTDAQWDVLKFINFKGIKDINHLSQTSKEMDTLTKDIMKGLKNLFPAMINHLGSFGIELNDELFKDESFMPSPSHIDLSSFLSQQWLTLYDLEKKTGFITALGNKENASEVFKRGMANFDWLKKKQEEANELCKEGTLKSTEKYIYVIPTQVFNENTPNPFYHHESKTLSISGIPIFFLPKEIENLVHLKMLLIGENYLISIPSQIKKLVNLKELNLEKNFLFSLPKGIGELKKLKELCIDYNQFASPPEIGELNSLQVFSIVNNKLTSIFDAEGKNWVATLIQNSPNLNEIDLAENPLDDASKTALGDLKVKYPNMTIKW